MSSAWFYASAKIVTDVKVNYGTLENPIWDNYFDDLVSEVDFTCYVRKRTHFYFIH